MAQIRVLKIHSVDGIPTEHALSDEITMGSFTVDGGGPVLSSTGLDMNNTDVSDIQDLVVVDPTTSTINQTAGNLVIDNIMAKDRSNVMSNASDIQFGVISDVVGEVDSLVLPKLAGAPTAVPAGGEGSFLYDSSSDKLWLYTSAGWDDLSSVSSANSLDNAYTAEVAVAARDVVYISSADNVSPAKADASATSAGAIGFATGSALAAAPVTVRSNGILGGFSSLTPGARYYISAATAGAVTSTIPTGSGHLIILAGIAKSATEMHIRIEDLGRRA